MRGRGCLGIKGLILENSMNKDLFLGLPQAQNKRLRKLEDSGDEGKGRKEEREGTTRGAGGGEFDLARAGGKELVRGAAIGGGSHRNFSEPDRFGCCLDLSHSSFLLRPKGGISNANVPRIFFFGLCRAYEHCPCTPLLAASCHSLLSYCFNLLGLPCSGTPPSHSTLSLV